MGLRAIRYCLSHRELFRTQLRALLRASAHGNVRVMFPLICGMSELREARAELEACRTELSRAGVPMGKRFPVGIMVETPSAALIADRLAQEADFFSVGTNDLIQYTLAIDRQNREVAYLYKPLHLSVLRSIQNIVGAAKASNIPVSMCGEMAGDPIYAMVLLALGFDELSMTSGQIPVVKNILRRSSRAEAKELLKAAMELTTAEEIERYIRTEMESASPLRTRERPREGASGRAAGQPLAQLLALLLRGLLARCGGHVAVGGGGAGGRVEIDRLRVLAHALQRVEVHALGGALAAGAGGRGAVAGSAQ